MLDDLSRSLVEHAIALDRISVPGVPDKTGHARFLRVQGTYTCPQIQTDIVILTFLGAVACASGVGAPACIAIAAQLALLNIIRINVGC